MINVNNAISFLKNATGKEFNENDTNELIMNKLSCHEPSYSDYSNYDNETETGIIIQRHTIELNSFETLSHNPVTFEVNVNEKWADGCGEFGFEDIEFLG